MTALENNIRSLKRSFGEVARQKLLAISGQAGHVAMAHESRALRRIMSKTGLSEPEVRAIPKYRRELAEAALRGQRCTHVNPVPMSRFNPNMEGLFKARYVARAFFKNVLRSTQLPLEHPVTIETLRQKAAESGYTVLAQYQAQAWVNLYRWYFKKKEKA